jgi:hypothetical protein
MKAVHDSVIGNKNLIGNIQGESSPDRQTVAGSVLFKWNLTESGMRIRSGSFAREERQVIHSCEKLLPYTFGLRQRHRNF